jgi:hypothetical protein
MTDELRDFARDAAAAMGFGDDDLEDPELEPDEDEREDDETEDEALESADEGDEEGEPVAAADLTNKEYDSLSAGFWASLSDSQLNAAQADEHLQAAMWAEYLAEQRIASDDPAVDAGEDDGAGNTAIELVDAVFSGRWTPRDPEGNAIPLGSGPTVWRACRNETGPRSRAGTAGILRNGRHTACCRSSARTCRAPSSEHPGRGPRRGCRSRAATSSRPRAMLDRWTTVTTRSSRCSRRCSPAGLCAGSSAARRCRRRGARCRSRERPGSSRTLARGHQAPAWRPAQGSGGVARGEGGASGHRRRCSPSTVGVGCGL